VRWLIQHPEPASSCCSRSLSVVVVAIMLALLLLLVVGLETFGMLALLNVVHACCGSSLFIAL